MSRFSNLPSHAAFRAALDLRLRAAGIASTATGPAGAAEGEGEQVRPLLDHFSRNFSVQGKLLCVTVHASHHCQRVRMSILRILRSHDARKLKLKPVRKPSAESEHFQTVRQSDVLFFVQCNNRFFRRTQPVGLTRCGLRKCC